MAELVTYMIGGWVGIVGATILEGVFRGAWRQAENEGKTFNEWAFRRVLIGSAIAIPIIIIPAISRA